MKLSFRLERSGMEKSPIIKQLLFLQEISRLHFVALEMTMLFNVFHKKITTNPLDEHSWDTEAEISEAGHE